MRVGELQKITAETGETLSVLIAEPGGTLHHVAEARHVEIGGERTLVLQAADVAVPVDPTEDDARHATAAGVAWASSQPGPALPAASSRAGRSPRAAAAAGPARRGSRYGRRGSS